MTAGAKFQLGIGIKTIVIDGFCKRPFHQIGDACDQDDQVGHVADCLIGIAHPVIDMDGTGRGDQTDKKANTHQHLEAEPDKAHALATNGSQHHAQR